MPFALNRNIGLLLASDTAERLKSELKIVKTELTRQKWETEVQKISCQELQSKLEDYDHMREYRNKLHNELHHIVKQQKQSVYENEKTSKIQELEFKL